MWLLLGISFVLALLCFLLTRRKKNSPKKQVIFVHLDLGIGGAERLVVDAARATQLLDYEVLILTTNHPRERAFEETIDGTVKVEVHGKFIPHHFSNRFQLVFSVLRMWYLSFKLVLCYNPDTIFCDGVSACIPILRLSGSKVVFYCHFPDLLLTRKQSAIRTLYRYPLNFLEEVTTAMADIVLVNSEFTLSVFKQTFKGIKATPTVVYPCVDEKNLQQLLDQKTTISIPQKRGIFLSINRFHPNKNISLAVEAFSELLQRFQTSKNDFMLIVSGGYDGRVRENVEYLNQLKKVAEKNKLSFEVITETNNFPDKQIVFVLNLSDAQKMQLLKTSTALLYTPINEHFGIVPLEAMFASTPVIATQTGGLLETVTTKKECGILYPAESKPFADGMEYLINNPEKKISMGAAGRRRVLDYFSLQKLATNLKAVL